MLTAIMSQKVDGSKNFRSLPTGQGPGLQWALNVNSTSRKACIAWPPMRRSGKSAIDAILMLPKSMTTVTNGGLNAGHSTPQRRRSVIFLIIYNKSHNIKLLLIRTVRDRYISLQEKCITLRSSCAVQMFLQ